jgi:hypothetical protein
MTDAYEIRQRTEYAVLCQAALEIILNNHR